MKGSCGDTMSSPGDVRGEGDETGGGIGDEGGGMSVPKSGPRSGGGEEGGGEDGTGGGVGIRGTGVRTGGVAIGITDGSASGIGGGVIGESCRLIVRIS